MSMIISALCLVGLLVFTIIGLCKRTFRALTLLVLIAITALLAGILCKPVAGAISDYAMNTLLPNLLGTSTSDLLANEVIAEVISVLMRAAVAPLVFLILFIALYVVLSILDLILCAALRLKKKFPKLPKALDRLAGACTGLLCGVLFIWAIVTPLFGYLNFAGDLAGSALSSEEESTSVIDMITEAPVAKQIYALGGESVFDSLSTVKWEGDKVSLKRDTAMMLDSIDAITSLGSGSVSDYGKDQAQALQKLADNTEESALLSFVFAEFLSDAGEAWTTGETYMGMEAPGAGGNYGRITNAFYTVFATTDKDVVASDLASFADVFDLLYKKGLFSTLDGDEGENDFATKLTENGVIDEFYEILDANPRMQPVKVAFGDTGMSVMLNELGGSAGDLKENHGVLLGDMASALKASVAESGEMNRDVLQAETDKALAESDVQLEESVRKLVVDSLMDEFTAEELVALDEDTIVDRMVVRFEGVET